MKSAASWAVKALVEATPISGPALVVMTPAARRVTADPTTLQMARVLEPLAISSCWAAMVSAVSPDWVMRRPRSGRVGDGVAVAVFGGVVDVDGEAGEAFDHELAGEPGVPTGAAGGDGDAGGGAEVVVGEAHVAEVDFAGVEGDAAEGGVADGAGLLVDFLEHEVLVAGFFGLDGVPGDALGGEGAGIAGEVGQGDALGGEGGALAVLEEVDQCGCGGECRGRRRRGSIRRLRCRGRRAGLGGQRLACRARGRRGRRWRRLR